MKQTVLLVDDDVNVLYGLARALRKQPYHLYTARSAEEAMDALKAHCVDVIVSDEQMTGLCGTDLLVWVARNYPEIVRIVLTGHVTVDSALRAINDGQVYQYLVKPCSDLHLMSMICKALEYKEMTTQHQALLQVRKQHVKDLERYQQDLEILTRLAVCDLHKPLEVAFGGLQMLSEHYGDVFDSKINSVIRDVREAATDVQRVLNDLLTHTRAMQRPESDADHGASSSPPEEAVCQ